MIANPFQESLKSQIEELLAKHGLPADTKVHERLGEFFYEICFQPYSAWIYSDGAGLSGPDLDQRFEIYDYDSLDDLAAAYFSFAQNFIRLLP